MKLSLDNRYLKSLFPTTITTSYLNQNEIYNGKNIFKIMIINMILYIIIIFIIAINNYNDN